MRPPDRPLAGREVPRLLVPPDRHVDGDREQLVAQPLVRREHLAAGGPALAAVAERDAHERVVVVDTALDQPRVPLAAKQPVGVPHLESPVEPTLHDSALEGAGPQREVGCLWIAVEVEQADAVVMLQHVLEIRSKLEPKQIFEKRRVQLPDALLQRREIPLGLPRSPDRDERDAAPVGCRHDAALARAVPSATSATMMIRNHRITGPAGSLLCMPGSVHRNAPAGLQDQPGRAIRC